MLPILRDPKEAAVLYELTKRLRSETWYYSMRAAGFGAAGVGALLICVAVALTIYVNGTALAGKWLTAAGTSFGGALTKALGNTTVKIDGNVGLAPGGEVGIAKGSSVSVSGGEVRIKDGATVTVAPGAVIGIDQKSSLRVDGEIRATIPRPTQAELGPDARPQSQADVWTDYTIFKTVPLGSKRRVVTGWHFDEQHKLTEQYCYYGEDVDESSEATITIGSNGQFKQPKSFPKSVDVQAAYSNCVWR